MTPADTNHTGRSHTTTTCVAPSAGRSDSEQKEITMLTALRRRLSYANVAATLALLFAMSGGALAASHYLITSTKQIKPSVLKQLKGKSGATGTQGPAGATGLAGPAGPTGGVGPQGPGGAPGVKGENGASVTSAEVSKTSATCSKQGGSEFTAAEGKKTTACNGKEGSPWTLGGILPSKATETGTFAFGEVHASAPSAVIVPISFTIPLKTPLFGGTESEPVCFANPPTPACQVHYINPGGKEVPVGGVELVDHPACPGTPEKPEAKPGNLCVYAAAEEHISAGGQNGVIHPSGSPTVSEFPGASPAGAFMYLSESGGPPNGWGTWAVTAE